MIGNVLCVIDVLYPGLVSDDGLFGLCTSLHVEDDLSTTASLHVEDDLSTTASLHVENELSDGVVDEHHIVPGVMVTGTPTMCQEEVSCLDASLEICTK